MPWIDMVKPPRVQPLPDVLTVEELARLIARTRERRYRAFWVATYSMGLRLGETLNLQVRDIDAQLMRVHVRMGKGRKDRFVLLPRITLVALRRQWAAHRHPRWLFPGQPGPRGGHATRVMDRTGTQRAFARAAANAGINKRVSIHSLRHSHATHLIEAGLSLCAVQDQLGHVDPRTTARYVPATEKSRVDQQTVVNRLVETLAAAVRGQPRGA